MTSKQDIIVAGGGRVGLQTARLLADRDNDVSIIEPDPDVVDEIADEWIATVIRGDASTPDIQKQAGVEGADAIAALTGHAGLNLAICLVAKELNPEIRTVTRIQEATGEAYAEFVDGVVFPEHAGARVAANEIVGSDVQTLADVTGRIDVMQIRVQEGAPAAGKTLSEVRFPAGALVVSGEEGEQIAQPETVIEPGKRYVVAVDPDVADEVMNLLRG
ncbi:potassium channel family protein [Halobellus rubicundus]|uniref:TrkA family potassium uptake protein n=1 Tax=Halobellus rubicundus TaxID=2996466 RepID=A0ABD5MH05_9EURY